MLKNYPKEVFETQEELDQYLKWWQEKLFLTDWIITANVCYPCDFFECDSMGENSFDLINRCCVIRILNPKYYGEQIMRYCAEKILVHELLHCKYNWLKNNGSYEGQYIDAVEHSLLEKMAKSLIMTKYDLTLDYFKNRRE